VQRNWLNARNLTKCATFGQMRAHLAKRCEFCQMPRVLSIGQMRSAFAQLRCAFGQMRRLVKRALHRHDRDIQQGGPTSVCLLYGYLPVSTAALLKKLWMNFYERGKQ